ncbi:MAG: diguanylate cyclase [Gammaproteobacteria bacterium]|nr:diguanylate cyclase [Gammaproteobacteria bacterium]
MYSSSSHIDTHNTHDVFRSIRALDTGIANHESWYNEVHQSLICGSSHSSSDDLREDAHCCCKFGKWLYSQETDALKPLDTFHSVVDKHQQMHALAREILIKSGSKESIVEKEYRDFTSRAMDFKLNVRNLQYKLMSQVCVVDHLTGTWNRHVMYSKLHQEKERQARTGHPCTICMMDIDHFKQVNDNHGHIIGDQVLKTVVDYCRTSLRKYDSIYRYGGEEFLFCLPDTEHEEASAVIERLCTSLSKHPVTLPNGDDLFVTASFGMVSMQKDISLEDSIQAADHALLCAKAQGRNRVCYWEDGLTSFE